MYVYMYVRMYVLCMYVWSYESTKIQPVCVLLFLSISPSTIPSAISNCYAHNLRKSLYDFLPPSAIPISLVQTFFRIIFAQTIDVPYIAEETVCHERTPWSRVLAEKLTVAHLFRSINKCKTSIAYCILSCTLIEPSYGLYL